jgi:hypothetical protein
LHELALLSHGLAASRSVSNITGYLASSLVLATFSMKSMRLLRVTALASNVAFILYAGMDDLKPILILHCLLLPLNFIRLFQLEQERRRQPLTRTFAGTEQGPTARALTASRLPDLARVGSRSGTNMFRPPHTPPTPVPDPRVTSM